MEVSSTSSTGLQLVSFCQCYTNFDIPGRRVSIKYLLPTDLHVGFLIGTFMLMIDVGTARPLWIVVGE